MTKSASMTVVQAWEPGVEVPATAWWDYPEPVECEICERSVTDYVAVATGGELGGNDYVCDDCWAAEVDSGDVKIVYAGPAVETELPFA